MYRHSQSEPAVPQQPYGWRHNRKFGAPKPSLPPPTSSPGSFFHLICARQEFDGSKFSAGQLRFRKHQEIKLRAKAKSMGYDLIPLQAVG